MGQIHSRALWRRAGQRLRWLVALTAVLSLVVAGCADDDDDAATGGGGDAASSDEPIVIGGTLGLTGAFSGPSAGYQATYDYWQEQINADGGLLGREVEMLIYDDESTPATAQQLYQRLINDDQVDLLLAPYTTAVGGAILPISERAGVLLYNAGFVSKELHSTSQFLVTAWPYQEHEYPLGLFRYIESLPEDERPETLAIATAQNPFTLVVRDGFEGEGGVLNLAEEAGIEVVFNEEYDQAATDLTSLVEGAASSGADMFVALSLPNDSALIARTVEQVGYQPMIYCSCGSQVTTLPSWPDLGPAALNVFSTAAAWPTQDNEGIAELTDHILETLDYPALPSYAAVSYAILQVLQQSVEGTESLDSQVLRDYIAENSFATAVGDLTYLEDGTVEFNALTVQYQDGGNQVIWPEEERTGEPVLPFRS